MKNKLKWMIIFGLILFTSCCTLRTYTPTDGIIYSGGTILIVQSNGQQIIIKK